MSMKSICVVTCLCAGLCALPVASAPEKKAPPRAAGKRAAPKSDVVPRTRVMKDFGAAYSAPTGTRTVRTVYIGGVKYGKEARGGAEVPLQTHRVAVIAELTECGMRLRTTWEVRYYRLETDWIFRDAGQIASATEAQPKKKLPVPDDATMQRCVTEIVARNHPDLSVRSITILRTKGGWNLCAPSFHVTSKVDAVMRDQVHNTIATYECLYACVMEYRNGAWSPVRGTCVYRGKEAAACHVGTMCRQLAVESTIPAISNDDASRLLRAALEREYYFKKNNIAVEEFATIRRLPAEVFGTKIPFTHRAVFVIDENREDPSGDPALRGRYRAVRAVYECIVSGHLRYLVGEQKWEASIDACCQANGASCEGPCAAPSRSCRRLGEK